PDCSDRFSASVCEATPTDPSRQRGLVHRFHCERLWRNGVSLLHFINGLRRGRQWSLHILVEPRTPCRSFRSRTCEWSTAARSFSMASTSTSTPMRSSPCSAPTVPANRRRSRSSKGSRSASSDHGKWRPRQLLSHLSDFYRHY